MLLYTKPITLTLTSVFTVIQQRRNTLKKIGILNTLKTNRDLCLQDKAIIWS